MGWLLAFVGLAGFVVGALALAKGFSWKIAAILLIGSWVALFEGATIAGTTAGNPVSEPVPTPSRSPSPTAPPLALVVNTPTRPPGLPAGAVDTLISRHVEGDTMWVGGGKLPPGPSALRLTGVDSPDLKACQGEEAAEFAVSQLPAGSTVYLLAGNPDKDSSGRLLRYVWTARGELFNEILAREGLARTTSSLGSDEYAKRIRGAESQAKAAKIGVWGECTTPRKTSPSPRPSPQPAAVAGTSPKIACEPTIPDFCVAPRPPDLDCEDIGRTNFRVLAPDPHHLDDGGTPGVGCETESEEPSLFSNGGDTDSDDDDDEDEDEDEDDSGNTPGAS